MARSTTLTLLRHAQSSANLKGVLAGRIEGISLSPAGLEQAQQLANSLSTTNFSSIYVSPLQRCQETVAPLLKAKKQRANKSREIIEMDYGMWSGKKLSLLAKKKEWASIQSAPSHFRFPQGESFEEMRSRVIAFIESKRLDGGEILVVTHGDVIKVVLAHYLGTPLDLFQRITIDPSSLSTLNFNGDSVRVNRINDTSYLTGHSRSQKRGPHDLGGGAGPR